MEKDNRPWGSFEVVDEGDRYKVKKLVIKPGEVLSLQKHYHRAEHWVVVKGTAAVIKDGEHHYVTENQSIYIAQHENHRLKNPGKIDLIVIEVQTGSYLGEDDIERLEDVYGRIKDKSNKNK